MDLLVVLCTFPNAETARAIASAVVEEKLAACANLLPGITSIYRWEGKMECGDEVMGLIKTTKDKYPALESRIRSLHPYQVPEILALPMEKGLEAYAGWVREECGSVKTE